MPAFSGTLATIAILSAAGAAGTSIGLAKRRARKQREAEAANPELALGPPPAAPSSALQAQSDAIAAGRRRPALRPFGAPTGAPTGAQLNIQRAEPAVRRPRYKAVA